MADHHDDYLDSALDLLRSRQWAGPATHPVLEKQFMHSNQESRGLNLRIVLGIAGALIGCGAVAAATRPAWRSAIFGAAQPPAPLKIIAAGSEHQATAAEPAAATDATRTRVQTRAQAGAAPEPAAAPAPIAAAAMPELQAEPIEGVSEIFEAAAAPEPERAGWLRTADPAWFYEQAFAAYLERYVAGDVQGCAAIACMADGGSARSGYWLGSGVRLGAELADNVAQGVVQFTVAVTDRRRIRTWSLNSCPCSGTYPWLESRMRSSRPGSSPFNRATGRLRGSLSSKACRPRNPDRTASALRSEASA